MLGSRMREARLAARLTGPVLAERLAVSHGAVYQWERGETRPRAGAFYRWLDAVGIPSEDRPEWWVALAVEV